MFINKLTNDIINKVQIEIQREENKIKINNNIVKPLMKMFVDRVYSFVLLSFLLYVLVLILVIANFAIVLVKK